MKILIAGATGFLGSFVAQTFLTETYQVAIVKRSTSDCWRVQSYLTKVSSYNIDEQSITEICNDFTPDVVINCVCNYGRNGVSIHSVIKANLTFGVELLNAAIKSNAKAYLNTGTLLPRHVNSYSLSKHQLVDWLKFYSKDIQVINFRVEHMIGPRDDENKFIYWLIKRIKSLKQGEKIDLTSGVQKRDIIDVRDVSAAFFIVVKNLSRLDAYTDLDVGSGNLIRVKDFIYKLVEMISSSNKDVLIDSLNFGAVPYRENDVMEPELNNSKLIGLGWRIDNDLEKSINSILSDIY